MKPNPYVFRIDWSDLKAVTLAVLSGNVSQFKLRHNAKIADSELNFGVSEESFKGFSRGQLERWLREGYESESIHGLEEFIPPIREKRKFVFGEEGDEFHYDLAASGDDNYMSHFTKRDEIPGLAIEAHISVISATDARVISDYSRWLCRVIYSCESAGIDTEVSLTTEARRMVRETESPMLTKIRVKQENEAVDFLSWSAMISPAAMRGMIFCARIIHADESGFNISPTMGSSKTGKPHDWGVKFEPENRTIRIDCPYHPRSFPESEMQRQLIAALREAQTNAN